MFRSKLSVAMSELATLAKRLANQFSTNGKRSYKKFRFNF